MYTSNLNSIQKGLGAVDTQFASKLFQDHYNGLSASRKLDIATNLMKGNTNPLTDEVVKVSVKFCSKGIWETVKDKVKSIFGK